MHRLKALAVFAVCALTAQAATWEIDSAHSSAQFSVRHMMVSNVRGGFGKVTGTIEFDPANPAAAAVDVTIDATTVDTRNVKRDADLKSPNFFDVEKFPTITFKSKKAEKLGEAKFRIVGDLTIHGVTKEVALDVDGPSPEVKAQGRSRIGASATTKINRKDFGLMWNRPIETGGVVVGDDVAITIDVELTRRS